MDPVTTLLALIASCAAALCIYLAAPRQQWLAQPWPAVAGRGAGALLSLLALALWLQTMQAAPAILTLLTLGMALFIALPYLAAWRRLQRERRDE